MSDKLNGDIHVLSTTWTKVYPSTQIFPSINLFPISEDAVTEFYLKQDANFKVDDKLSGQVTSTELLTVDGNISYETDKLDNNIVIQLVITGNMTQ